MTLEQFCRAVYTVGKKYGGSVTSWGRSPQHSAAVGGSPTDPHTQWVGVDMVYDSGPNRGDATHPQYPPKSCPLCSEQGLKVLHEKGHDHYQPADLVPGVPYGV